jgi:hypothetical protein
MFRALAHRLTTRRPLQVQFCDTCSQVCTPTCRANALRERARTTVLTLTSRW